jgi:hypothetical protein
VQKVQQAYTPALQQGHCQETGNNNYFVSLFIASSYDYCCRVAIVSDQGHTSGDDHSNNKKRRCATPSEGKSPDSSSYNSASDSFQDNRTTISKFSSHSSGDNFGCDSSSGNMNYLNTQTGRIASSFLIQRSEEVLKMFEEGETWSSN